MTSAVASATQVYEVFIRATPEEVWEAITRPEFTKQYFFDSLVTVTPDSYRGVDAKGADMVVAGVSEYDPPRKLVHGWRSLYNPEATGEDESRVTWEIEPRDGGVTRLRVVHDRLEKSPITAADVAGGWSWVLSGLKTLLETGRPMAGG